MDEPKFKDNQRSSNPKLHLLYVRWAAVHLTKIDTCLRMLSDLSNSNMHPIILAMNQERQKLCFENAAYWDAQTILDGINDRPRHFYRSELDELSNPDEVPVE